MLSFESEEIESIFKSSSKGELTVTAALIDSIYVPAEKNHLVQLVAFLVGQLNSGSHNLDIFNLEKSKSLISAWIGKSQEISTKIKRMREKLNKTPTMKVFVTSMNKNGKE